MGKELERSSDSKARLSNMTFPCLGRCSGREGQIFGDPESEREGDGGDRATKKIPGFEYVLYSWPVLKRGHFEVKGSPVHQKPLGHLQKGWGCFLNPCEATCYSHGLGEGRLTFKRKEREEEKRKKG